MHEELYVVPQRLIMGKTLRGILMLILVAALSVAVLLTSATWWGNKTADASVQQTMIAKDIGADILPPPMYLVELRLVLGMLSDGSMPLATAQSEVGRLTQEYQARVAYWKPQNLHGLESSLFGTQHEHAERFLAGAQSVLKAAASGNADATKQAMAHAHQDYLAHRQGVDATVKKSNVFAAQAMADYAETKHRVFVFEIVLFVLGCIGLIGLSQWARRTVWRSTGGEPAEVAHIARAVAAGDLTVHVPVAPGDDSSVMAAMAHMCANLATLVKNVQGSSDVIATGAQQIASGNSDLNQRTEHQAANLQQTAAAMEQFAGTVKTTAETAGQATQMAQSASEVAIMGSTVVDKVVSTMNDISGSSQKIAEINLVIESIAFQTNILALNAAVEAARAGEQGRGFAVVASEVRSLAQRSATAAKEIKDLIGSNVSRVSEGAALVDQAGHTMTEIVQHVQKVTDLISEIGLATQEQSRGIDAVSQSVTQLDGVTQQNTTLVEESFAAARSLEEQVQQLIAQVLHFKVTRV